jgi:hypothetical protein
VHVDQFDHVPLLQVRLWVPVLQFPQGCEAAPTHEQLPHVQLEVQVSVPSVPHDWVAFGAQTPSPEQADHALHVPALHVRVCVPQLPQGWLSAPTHVTHVPHPHVD